MDIDQEPGAWVRGIVGFNPRYPYGYRPRPEAWDSPEDGVSIHDTRMDIDPIGAGNLPIQKVSIHDTRMDIDTRSNPPVADNMVSIHDTRMDIDNN